MLTSVSLQQWHFVSLDQNVTLAKNERQLSVKLRLKSLGWIDLNADLARNPPLKNPGSDQHIYMYPGIPDMCVVETGMVRVWLNRKYQQTTTCLNTANGRFTIKVFLLYWSLICQPISHLNVFDETYLCINYIYTFVSFAKVCVWLWKLPDPAGQCWAPQHHRNAVTPFRQTSQPVSGSKLLLVDPLVYSKQLGLDTVSMKFVGQPNATGHQ